MLQVDRTMTHSTLLDAPPQSSRLWSLVSWSDPYTFEAPDREVAALLVLVLGRGAYGAHTADAGEPLEVPVLRSVAADDDPDSFDLWWHGQFGRLVAESRDALLRDLILALDSMLIGSPNDRRDFEAFAGSRWMDRRDAWHQERLASRNDVGRLAWSLAASGRKELAA